MIIEEDFKDPKWAVKFDIIAQTTGDKMPVSVYSIIFRSYHIYNLINFQKKRSQKKKKIRMKRLILLLISFYQKR
jgi:hypothetical protein